MAIKQTIKLERIDILEMENISLKIAAAKAELQRLVDAKRAIGKRISDEYKIDDLNRYIFNPSTGEGKRIGTAEKEAVNE